MNGFIRPPELRGGSPKSMAIVIIARHVLTRTSIFSILKREFPEFDIVEMARTDELDFAKGRDLRLVALDIEDKAVSDPVVEDDFAAIAKICPCVPVALLSTRGDEASAAMRRGVRGFFLPSIPLEVAIAGLRLVLAGGVYLPIDTGASEPSRFEMIDASPAAQNPSPIPDALAAERDNPTVDLTPREKQVLAALELGLPNKLIAARLNLSENTVKMHMRHIMRKCSARNRTEAVIFCSGRLAPADGYGRRISSP